MMNVSEMLTAIKMDLGIFGVALPFEDENKSLHDTIKLRTIKTFSQFYPYVLRVDLEIKDLKVLKSDYSESIYEIPDVFGDRRLLTVRRVQQRNKLAGTGYLSPSFDDTFSIYDSLMLGQAQANLLSAAMPPFTFKFDQPNILRLYNMSTIANEITVEFGLEHTENLATIPNTAWEAFYKLALLDIKRMLYGVLKHYDQLQTAYGTINLKIDDWANAESDREALLNEWRETYHMDADQFLII